MVPEQGNAPAPQVQDQEKKADEATTEDTEKKGD
jgi:hypothetical protein